MDHTDVFRKSGAKAIWPDHEKKLNRYVRFQTSFDGRIGDPVSFFIAADTNYELYINGQLALFDQYHDYPNEKVYDECDISALLCNGDNLVSILVYSQGIESGQHLPGLPMVIFAAIRDGECILRSDERIKCNSACEFKQGDMTRINVERMFSYEIDLRQDDGWRERNVSKDWANAVLCDESSINFERRPIPMIKLKEHCRGKITACGTFEVNNGKTVSERMQYAALSFCEIKDVLKDEDGTLTVMKDNVYWIADLGEETAGYMTIDVDAEAGSELDIAIGEHLVDLRVRSWVANKNYGYKTICRSGRQKHSFYMARNAGRYIEIFAHRGIHKVYEVAMIKAEYPVGFCSTLDTGDRLFNKIYTTAQYTCQLCMHEHFEDCPQREQSLYGGDGRNQMLACYYAFGETKMIRASLKLLAQGQRENGLLEITAPSYFEKTIPSFSLSWACAVREYLLFTGDMDFGREMLPHIKRLLRYFEFDDETGLIRRPYGKSIWNFYEWSDGFTVWNDDGSIRTDAPINSFYMFTLKNCADIASWLGDTEEEKWISQCREKIFRSFHKTFYNADRGAYSSFAEEKHQHFAQLTQAWALLGDCVPEEYKDTIRAAVADKKNNRVSLGLSTYKYDALMQDPDRYLQYVLDDIEDLWGKMLYKDSTSFWETIDGSEDFARAGSLCHGWASTPVYMFWKYLGGIYPIEPGFKSILPKAANDSIHLEGILKTQQGIFNIKINGKNALVKKVI